MGEFGAVVSYFGNDLLVISQNTHNWQKGPKRETYSETLSVIASTTYKDGSIPKR